MLLLLVLYSRTVHSGKGLKLVKVKSNPCYTATSLLCMRLKENEALYRTGRIHLKNLSPSPRTAPRRACSEQDPGLESPDFLRP